MGGSEVKRLGMKYSGASLPTWGDEALIVRASAAILVVLLLLVLVLRLLLLPLPLLLCLKTVRGRGRVRRARDLITQLVGCPAL